MFTQPQRTTNYRENISPATRLELNRLFATAVVDADFRAKLLNDPQGALDKGYQERGFILDDDEKELLSSIRAQSLQDLATQMLVALQSRPILVPQIVYAR